MPALPVPFPACPGPGRETKKNLADCQLLSLMWMPLPRLEASLPMTGWGKKRDDLGLRAKGIVLSGSGLPIVLCAVDWIGIGNESQDAFKARLAKAASTIPSRVAVHTVHQHDAPSAIGVRKKILVDAGLDPPRLLKVSF